jgi:hypothetical protein
MDLARDILVFLHLIGMAAVFGGLFVQLRADPRVVNSAMVHGILTQLVTGLLLVGLLEADDADVDHAKVGVKLVVALAIAVLVFVHRRRGALSAGIFFTLLGLTVLNVGVAVFW